MSAAGATSPSGAQRARQIVFLLAAAFCLTPWASPAIGLALGLALALVGWAVFSAESKSASKMLIQAAVVLLGFSMSLREVAQSGALGMAFAVGTIAAVFAVGALLGGLFKTEPKVTALLSAGTAICGGSAIAATGSVIGATQAQMAVSLATVFILNGVGLYIFPPMGHWLGLSDQQFGTWAAVAIHDVSSVVGAASQFSTEALHTATTVKLSRTLWIIPVAFLAGWWVRRAMRADALSGTPIDGYTRAPFPWFVVLFVCASAVRTWAPGVESIEPYTYRSAKAMMTLALFLIGSGLSVSAIKAVGWRPMAQGVVMWIFLGAASLAVVKWLIV